MKLVLAAGIVMSSSIGHTEGDRPRGVPEALQRKGEEAQTERNAASDCIFRLQDNLYSRDPNVHAKMKGDQRELSTRPIEHTGISKSLWPACELRVLNERDD
jgi:hypothetical protein